LSLIAFVSVKAVHKHVDDNFTNPLGQSADAQVQGVWCNQFHQQNLGPTLPANTTRSFAQLLHLTLCASKISVPLLAQSSV